jgi:lantibiotic modifying enzyme
MRSTWDHPALMETHDMFYGLAGWGMAQLRFFLDTGNEEYLQQAIRAGEQLALTAKEENDTCYWSQSNTTVPVGFAHGASGVSLFLLYLHLVTGNERILDLGKKALDFDLAAAITNSEGSLTWQVRRTKGAPGVPYLRYGTAGVGLALVRYYRALGSPRYAEILDRLLPDVDRKYGIYPGRFIGLAGIGEFLLSLREIESFRARSSAALNRLLTGISLFRIETAKGTAFPGYELYRFSCDYATGSAGIALLMHQYLTHQSGDFLLDELFAPSLQAYSQSGPATVLERHSADGTTTIRL